MARRGRRWQARDAFGRFAAAPSSGGTSSISTSAGQSPSSVPSSTCRASSTMRVRQPPTSAAIPFIVRRPTTPASTAAVPLVDLEAIPKALPATSIPSATRKNKGKGTFIASCPVCKNYHGPSRNEDKLVVDFSCDENGVFTCEWKEKKFKFTFKFTEENGTRIQGVLPYKQIKAMAEELRIVLKKKVVKNMKQLKIIK